MIKYLEKKKILGFYSKSTSTVFTVPKREVLEKKKEKTYSVRN